MNANHSTKSEITIRWLAVETGKVADKLMDASELVRKAADLQLKAIEKIEHLVEEKTQLERSKNGTLGS